MARDLPSALTKQEERILGFEKTAFILGRSGTGKTSILIKKLLQREQSFGLTGGHSREGAAEEKKVLRQLFVTANSKLCKVVKQRIGFDVNETEEDPRLGINSDSFPLVVTFHQFLIMLDNSLGSSFFDRFHIERSLEALESTLVGFEKFNNLYWSHFPVNLTKRLDSLSVFTEITSQIKGSEKSLETASGKISREEYVSAYEGRSSLTQEQRQQIFQIFEVYEKLKMEKEEVDIADFQRYLYYQLSQAGYTGDKVDYVYVDEIQDLTISGIALFKFICPNMEDGFMFSGDTAQAISKGVDFRYQDVRSLFYRKFLSQCNNEKKEKGIVSDTFVLTENFRAHSGIVQLSQCVIDLLLHFFPCAVDHIDPEIGLVKGEPPVLLHYSYKAMKNVFGGGKKVEFGADQVFVVRDKSSRDQLSRIVGNQALVIDILECKGLEFQDVILYNFFGSSPLKNWRVIYNFLLSENLSPSEVYSCPKFDLSKHYKLCSELKQLYVAITRARQRLWLCECTEASKPMFDLWKKKCVVEVRELTDSLIQAMQIVSTPEEWTARGIELYDELNYEMATLCFEKAGNEHWQKNSRAYALKAAAERIQMSNPDKANSYLKEAAKLFEEIGKTKTTGKQDILESYEPAATEVDQFCATEVVQFHRVPPTIDLISEKSVADQDCYSGNKQKTKLPINLDNFRKTCDAIDSLGDETGQVLMSNAQMIKENIDQDIVLLEDIKADVYKKLANAQSSAGKFFDKYQIWIRLRFERVLEGLKKITHLLVLSEVELCKNMADIKELSEKLKLKSVMGTLERQVINFLDEYHVAVEYSVKSVSKTEGIKENSEGAKGGKNRKTKKNKRGKGRNK